MRIERVWAMSNKWTFQIKPIMQLIKEEMGDTEPWADPFAGMTSPAHVRNDINLECPAEYHMDALEFIEQQSDCFYAGILFDPPWAWTHAKDIYGLKDKYPDMIQFYNYIRSCRKAIPRIIRANGKAIIFGKDSCGLGKSNGFEMTRALILCHQWQVSDTIVTVEQKTQSSLVEFGEEMAESLQEMMS